MLVGVHSPDGRPVLPGGFPIGRAPSYTCGLGLGETMTAQQLVGAALVLGGVVLVSLKAKA